MDRIEEVAALAEEAAEEADPWSGLVAFMEQMTAHAGRRSRPAADADVRHVRPG